MGKVHLAIAAALVVAAVILYVFVTRGGEEAAPGGQESSSATGSSRTASAGADSPASTQRPSAVGDLADAGIAPFETTNKDGTRVRDYRGRDVHRDPNAELQRPLKSLEIEPKLMSTMGLQVRGVAKRCKAEHGTDVPRGSRVQPRVTFSIREDRLTIDETELTLENIVDGSGFESCMRSGVIGLSIEAPGHAVIAAHKMAVPINLDQL